MPDVNLAAAATSSVARFQRGVDVEVGIYVRGMGLVSVEEVDGGQVTWREDTGSVRRGTLDEFRGEALERVDVTGDVGDADYLGHAYAVASSSGIDKAVRAAQLSKTIRRASTDDERELVLEWIEALASGREPKRRAAT